MKKTFSAVPSTLAQGAAVRFWSAVILTGFMTGIAAAGLTKLLEIVQRLVWGGFGTDLLATAERAGWQTSISALLAAGLITGLGQLLLKRLSSGNGIDVTAAIWFYAGRLPAFRTLASAILSVVIVGLGVSLGREGAPKQAGAVWANFLADRLALSDEQRRLIVSCGAGAGMAAAYGVPLGGALFSIEVMRGMLALRFVLPALMTSLTASATAWIFLRDAPTYTIPSFASSRSILLWTLIAGPIAGAFSVGYVRLIAWAERNQPENWWKVVTPIVALGLLGVVSVWYPQLLGNGRDVSQIAFSSAAPASLLCVLMVLKPAATILCIRCGAPGGLFTPSLTAGAMLGGTLGWMWGLIWPDSNIGFFSFLGAGAVLAATTQGPISTVILLMEMTGRDRSFALPLLLIVVIATLVARTIEPRSIYDAKLSDEELEARQKSRDLTQI